MCLTGVMGVTTPTSLSASYPLHQFLEESGVKVNHAWCDSPVIWDIDQQKFVTTGHIMNLPAAIVTLAITVLLVCKPETG